MVRVVLLLIALLAAVLAIPDKYTTQFDNVEVERLLSNDRIFNKIFQCLLDEGGCTPDLIELKKLLPNVLKNGCSKCTEVQKSGARKALKYIIEKRPKDFERLEKKYDPEGIYRTQYKDLAAKDGIKL